VAFAVQKGALTNKEIPVTKHLPAISTFAFAMTFTAATACVVGTDEPMDDGVETADETLDDEATTELAVPTDAPSALGDTDDLQHIGAVQLNPAIFYDTAERELLADLNAYRRAHGAGALRVSIAESGRALQNAFDLSDEGAVLMDEAPAFYAIARSPAEVFQKMGARTRAELAKSEYKRIGIGRVSIDGINWGWGVSLGTAKDAILSIGVTSVASNGKFESAAGFSWPTPPAQVRTINKWFLDGTEFSVGPEPSAAFSGNVGLELFDLGRATATQVVRAAPMVRYRLSVMTRAAAALNGSQVVRLQFLDKDFARIGGLDVDTGSATAWHKLSTGLLVSPDRTKFVRIILGDSNVRSDTGTHWYDSVQLEAF
jgi:hypothetical protein